jgi:putative peptidoglycan lipid II flippase
MQPDQQEPHRARRIVRQSGYTTVAAAVGVATGLLLDVLIAARFGAGQATDSLFVAARIPLGIVAILMVGANQALVPAITTSLERRGEDPTWRLVSTLLTGTILLGLALVALVAILADPLMRLTAPGLSQAAIVEAAQMTRILFLVVPLIGAAEVLRAVLNARYLFVAPAAMHAVMNAIAAAIVGMVAGGVGIVVWAYVAGAMVQLVFMVVMAVGRGIHLRPSFQLRDPEATAAARLTVRPLAGASLNPLARIGEQLFASFLPAGSITILNYGYRLISAIGGAVLFRSVMVALLPRLTSVTARGDDRGVRRLTNLGLRIMLAVSLSLTPFMAVLATPAAVALFRRGSFSRDDATLLGVVLAVYAASLVGSAVQRALLAPFYARLDTRTPLRNTIYGVGAGLLMVPVFVLPFGHREFAVVGIAIAYSLSQYVHVAHAWWRLRGIGISIEGVWSTAVRWGAAATVAGAVLLAGYSLFDLGDPTARARLVAELLAVALGGVVGGAAALAVFGRSEVRAIRELFRPTRAPTS